MRVVLSGRAVFRSVYRQWKGSRRPRVLNSVDFRRWFSFSSLSTTASTTATTTTTTTGSNCSLSALVDDLLSNVADEYFLATGNDDDDDDGGGVTPLTAIQPDSGRRQRKKKLHTVAFSGGVDSSLVAFLLHTVAAGQNGHDDQSQAAADRATTGTTLASYDQDHHLQQQRHVVRAVLGVSPAVSAEQRDQAVRIAAHIGIDYREVPTTEGTVPLYIANDGFACYACKSTLYSTLQSIYYNGDASSSPELPPPGSNPLFAPHHQPQRQHPQPHHHHELYNGTNKDDLRDPTRVGLWAAAEFKVHSPIAGLDKHMVRTVARHVGLPNADAAAAPCLRSRLAYGVPALPEHLHRIERAERFVRQQLLRYYMTTTTTSTGTDSDVIAAVNLRVRFLARGRARIEIDATHVDILRARWQSDAVVWDEVFLHDLGFTDYDVAAFRTGSVAMTTADAAVVAT